MSKTFKMILLLLCISIISSSYGQIISASEDEPSQFSLFVSERELPFDGETSKHTPESLSNVMIKDIPSSLKAAFDILGVVRWQLLIDESGKPLLTADDIDMYTFTGPYHVFHKAYITESFDVTEFRQSFAFEPLYAYIIQFDGLPVGVLYVTYAQGRYEYVYASSNAEAENMIAELDSLSSDLNQPEDDVVFLTIGSVRYAFNKDDQIKVTLPWTPDTVSFNDFVKAYYVSEMEMKALIEANNGVNDFGGSSNAADFFYNSDEFIRNYEAQNQLNKANADPLFVTAAILGVLLLFAAIFMLFMYMKKSKKEQ
ncbi:MAG: hypothetical protein FWH17_09665 [Oscillospiraceae bacterium]|nr:hypothetical protein [Oscillospiraceae bacterium]